ncbi:MAG: hypothetical protein ACYC59_01735 [Anaerolineaceae bacterium]
MVDFIQMNCPSCGGQLQAQRDMQKMFCMHCGTELMLKQDDAGSLIPIKAREIQASTKLKEIHYSMATMDLLKSRIAELEEQVKQIRRTFLEYYQTIYTSAWNRKYFSDYEKEKKLPVNMENLYANYFDTWNDYIECNIPGYTTPSELIEFSHFIVRPKYKQDKYIETILAILEPLAPLAEELKNKKAQLNAMLEQAIEHGG